MPKKKNLFRKYGKELRSYQDYEAVTALVETPEEVVETPIHAIWNPESQAVQKPKLSIIFQTIKNEFHTMRESRVFMLPSIWLASNAVLTLFVLFLLVSNFSGRQYNKQESRYAIFSSKPLTLGASSIKLFGGDTRASVLDTVFESYNCPLAGKGSVFVKEADKNNIPYWIVAAISFQESNCGRKTPKNDGEETYNAWGWAVWGNNARSFDDWDAGIRTVSKYLGDKFFSKGITDTCEIMKVYTPPSNGSWCKGVNYFGDIIQGYKTPQN